jgi:hypothetical protein
MELRLKRLLKTGAIAVAAVWTLACTARPQAQRPGGQPGELQASAAALYQAYGEALSTPRREVIASFYHHAGAVLVINGVPRRASRAVLDSTYRGPWSPPAFFTWEGLEFDSVGPGRVIVTGGFRWQRSGLPDTSRYIYAALLEADDSGLAIRFEHETLRPKP